MVVLSSEVLCLSPVSSSWQEKLPLLSSLFHSIISVQSVSVGKFIPIIALSSLNYDQTLLDTAAMNFQFYFI